MNNVKKQKTLSELLCDECGDLDILNAALQNEENPYKIADKPMGIMEHENAWHYECYVLLADYSHVGEMLVLQLDSEGPQIKFESMEKVFLDEEAAWLDYDDGYVMRHAQDPSGYADFLNEIMPDGVKRA